VHPVPVPRVRSARSLVTGLLACATISCQDTLKPSPPGGGIPPITVAYVCDNDFDLQSVSPTALTARYAVAGTAEQGELLLPAPTAESAPRTTRLVTLHRGTLRVSYGDQDVAPVANAGIACPPASRQEPQATSGEWTAPFDWPIVAVHLHLLPNGDVLSWGRVGDPQVWHTETEAFTAASSMSMLFCSGHAFLPDGRLLVTGGHISDEHGLPDANIFDPGSGAWAPITPMSRGRWYPTSTTLEDGQVLTLGGRDETGTQVELPEVWTGRAWRSLAGASRPVPYYPRVFVAPNGLVFYAGELQQSAYLDPRGGGRWTAVSTSNYGRRDYGSAVMYRPGRVLILGGSEPPDGAPTTTAEVIDLTLAAPEWRYTAPMAHARRQFNATLLPDGSVLATGGTSAAGFSDPAGAVRAAEVWDPATEVWSSLASNRVTRVYHSTALLLPDGRILHSGSGDGRGLPRELNAEIFSPPYLFRGPRPSIDDVPEAVDYGQEFFLATRDAPRVVRATLVRLGSVTHGFDQNQRFLELSFQRAAGGLTVVAPARGSLAPPGHYLLFILSSSGVPSVANILRIGG
jgi:galactose oxidase